MLLIQTNLTTLSTNVSVVNICWFILYFAGSLINVPSSEVVLTLCSSLTLLYCKEPKEKMVDGKYHILMD